MRAKPGCPTEVRRALGCLREGGGGGITGKELRGAEDEEETDEKEGTPCALQALGQAESGNGKNKEKKNNVVMKNVGTLQSLSLAVVKSVVVGHDKQFADFTHVILFDFSYIKSSELISLNSSMSLLPYVGNY